MLVDQMNGSYNDISEALELVRDLYCAYKYIQRGQMFIQ